MMKVKTLTLALFLTLMAGIAGCSDPESSARVLHNEAITAEKEGRAEDAKAIYEQIVEKYPGTETAVEANKRLLATSQVEKVLGAAVDVMHSASLEKQRKNLLDTLDMFRLENGRYPTQEEALSALVIRPEGIRHWKGPYLEGDPDELLKVLSQFTYRFPGYRSPVEVDIK
jgi:hypothetical protein